MASDQPVVFITGDLGFFYDSNGLWNNYIPKNFKIILINNSGGGIFRILPGHKDTKEFDTFFETQHQLTARNLCEMHGLHYESVSEEAAFSKACKTFYSNNEQPQLLEVFTPRQINDTVLLNYFKFLK
jgi:2-succinyl-5-enolpyruvyl-6-hydroxy-3-cyclohexene-1-carboxylate synthase